MRIACFKQWMASNFLIKLESSYLGRPFIPPKQRDALTFALSYHEVQHAIFYPNFASTYGISRRFQIDAIMTHSTKYKGDHRRLLSCRQQNCSD